MGIGEVFVNNKWNLIEDLSLKKSSPIQLAQKYNTTIGNIGHQLKILEAYGLIKKEKVTNRDKGKPRTLFSLSNDYAYLISASKGFARKKLLQMTTHHDTILKMWFLEDSKYHYPLEKFYWKIDDYLGEINGIAVRIIEDNKIEILILTVDKKNLGKKIPNNDTITDKSGNSIQFKVKFLSNSDLKKFIGIVGYHIIHDPNGLLNCYKESFQK